MNGLWSFLDASITGALNKYIASTSGAISVGIAPLVATGITIWVMTYGMAVMRNEVADPVSVFVKNIVKISFIMTIALGSGVYQSVIADSVNAFLTGLVQIVSPDATGGVFQMIDQFDHKSSELALVIIGHGYTMLPIGGYLDIIAGLIIFCANTLLELMCGGFSVLAKLALSFILAFGPLFIAALAFPATAKFFDAWFGKVMNYVFLSVFMAAISTFSLVITTDYIDRMAQNVGKVNAIGDAFSLVGLVCALCLIAWQMPGIAAGLTGGVSLSGGGAGAFIGGMIAGRKSSGGSKGDAEPAGGGTIKDGGGSGAGGSDSEKVPAYRKATLDRLQK